MTKNQLASRYPKRYDEIRLSHSQHST